MNPLSMRFTTHLLALSLAVAGCSQNSTTGAQGRDAAPPASLDAKAAGALDAAAVPSQDAAAGSGGVAGLAGAGGSGGGTATGGNTNGTGGVTASGGNTNGSAGATVTGGNTKSAGGVSATGGNGSGGATATGGAGSGGSAGRDAAASDGTAAGGSTSRDAAATDGAVAGGSTSRDAAATGGSSADASAGPIATIRNGGFWNDTTGKRIEAHGGGFLRVQDSWYWVGEDKSVNSAGFKAVNCYASKDLTNWEFRNAIITKNTTPDLNTADRIIERPKVIYNDTTKKYVMWLHWEGANYAEAKAGVFTSDTVDGNYTYSSSFRPNNNMARDDNLFKDDDGKAYFMAAANENADMIIYQLSDDYLTIKTQLVTLWAGSKREAPAMFKQDKTYFLITSAATGWDSNQAKYGTATNIGGPWTPLQNLGDSTTYDTQSNYVIPVMGSKTTTFIFSGDRWQDPDLVSSKYIWFPIRVNGTSLTMDRNDQWQIDLTTGDWWPMVTDGGVAQKG
jgi:hypothetical protein